MVVAVFFLKCQGLYLLVIDTLLYKSIQNENVFKKIKNIKICIGEASHDPFSSTVLLFLRYYIPGVHRLGQLEMTDYIGY